MVIWYNYALLLKSAFLNKTGIIFMCSLKEFISGTKRQLLQDDKSTNDLATEPIIRPLLTFCLLHFLTTIRSTHQDTHHCRNMIRLKFEILGAQKPRYLCQQEGTNYQLCVV